MRARSILCCLIVSCCVVAGAAAQEAGSQAPGAPAEIPAGINDEFLSPDLDVDKWVQRFELESREIFAARTEILRQLALQPGQSIADIGAGTGFFARMFSGVAGEEGHVYAVEVSPRFLEHLARQCEETGLTNVTPVMASASSCLLPAASIDSAFVCDTYHHFAHPAETLGSLRRALKPGGQLVVIDFERIPGQSREWVIGHVRGDKAAFRAEIEQAGFEFVEEVEITGFVENYFLRFRKPEAAATGGSPADLPAGQ